MVNNFKISRRGFLKRTSAVFGTSIIGKTGISLASPKMIEPVEKSERLPREVWTASVTLYNFRCKTIEERIENMLKRMEEVVPFQPDIVCLTEIFPDAMVPGLPPIPERAEVVPGTIVKRFIEFAKKNNCYVICPLHTKKGEYVYNTAVLIGRNGNLVGEYHKIHPTESEMEGGVYPGPLEPPVFNTDFGKIGILICFDANWPDKWHSLKSKGAEIVFFPTAFPGGYILNSLAWSNNYYIVSCPWSSEAIIIDIMGQNVVESGRLRPWICAPINLDIEVFHWDFQAKKLKSLEGKYGEKVKVKIYHPEALFTIESRSPDITVPQLIKEFELVTYAGYIKRATQNQDKKRPR